MNIEENSLSINNTIDNEYDTQNFDLYYVIVDCYFDRFMSYLCSPQDLFNYKHYIQNAVSINTFNDYDSALDFHAPILKFINQHTKNMLGLDEQIRQQQLLFKQQINTIKNL